MEESIIESYKRHIEELNEIVKVIDDHIVINVHDAYNIHIERCNTHEKILAWVFHLTEKSWMTKEILRHFIRVAHDESGLEIPQV